MKKGRMWLQHTQPGKPKQLTVFRPKLFPNKKLHKIMKNRQRLVASTLLVMRISLAQIAFSAVFFTSLYARETSAQSILDKSFSISVENMQLKKVISSIQRQTKVKFTFSDNAIRAGRIVSYIAEEKKISDFLNDIFKTYSIGYQIIDEHIILVPVNQVEKINPWTESFRMPEPAKVISGTVSNDNNEPLPGVTVSEKNTSNAVVTNERGIYSITISKDIATLVFTSVGYAQQEASVGNLQSLDIVMKTSNKALDEVVVVGYGSKKRSDVTGTVSSVPKERLSKIPVTNILHAIEGSVAGVNVTQTSSVPGSSASVLVRGATSITGNTGPLVVLDGIPYSSTGGTINDINPNDIASIDILKDASATAIYGTRGANGVILITTKRGLTGKPVIRYNAYAGTENYAYKMKPMNAAQYVGKYAEWKAQRGVVNAFPVPSIAEQTNYAAGRTVDWLDEVSQQGFIHDHNISISGGTSDIKYFLSGDYLKEKGFLKGYQYHRASIRANVDVNITSYLSAGANLFFSTNNYDGGRINLTLAGQMSPYGQLYNPDGSYYIYPMYTELLYTNPLLGLYQDRIDRSKNISGNTYIEFKPAFVKGLRYRMNASYSYAPARTGTYTGRNANSTLGTANVTNWETNSWLIENLLMYDRDFGKHHVDATALYSAQQSDYFSAGVNATGFINDLLSFNNLGAGATISAGGLPQYNLGGNNVNAPSSGSFAARANLVSQMIRFNYGYDSRYLLSITARRDGYSAFGGNTNKYGVFPSAAIAWNIGNESFLENTVFISNLKIRASYGLVGNQTINPYGTITTSGTNRIPFNGISTIGVAASVLGNADLKWESTYGTNVGLDFGILKSRVSGTLDVYSTKTKDLVLLRALPTITGYTQILDNIGTVSNKGIELSLKTVNVDTRDFSWQSTINYSRNKNKIIDLYGDKKDDIGNRWFIGKPIQVIYDYQVTGVWQVGEDASQQDAGVKPGDLKFADINSSKAITADDRVILGSPYPDWIGGIINTVRYKDFNLSIFIQTAQGILKNNPVLTNADQSGIINVPASVQYWTPTNKINDRPGIGYVNPRGYNYPSDGSYTRVKDITISYNAPKRLVEKARIGALTLYVSGRNIYTWTKWIGWDPENTFDRATSTNANNYPLVRSFVLGANISLR
jgi:TonB-linked SusC/RagA family outer membrane protein